ncbi:MAG: YihY family inner membrane protein [Oscillospiraceae bacterium]|nr:YihY family inner membrane protein [Oscillospiraceae bacterium]
MKNLILRLKSLRYPKSRPLRVIREMYRVYIRNRVTRGAAALSYSLLLTLFPVLLVGAAVVGRLDFSGAAVSGDWADIIPEAAISVINDFLQYVSGGKSSVMLYVGAVTMLTTSAGAFRTIMSVFGDIQGERRFKGAGGYIFGFVLSLVFLAVIFLSGIVIVTGGWFIRLFEEYFDPGSIVGAWRWIRFILLFVTMFGVVYAIYFAAAPKRVKKLSLIPGSLAAAALTVAVSTVFSRLISESTKYAVVYGSLASIIILAVWLYALGLVVIMGNVLNISIVRIYGNGSITKKTDGQRD